MYFVDLLFDLYYLVFFFKQKTAYEMRISDWSSDVCSSDLLLVTPTRISGRIAMKVLASLPPVNSAGSFTSLAGSPSPSPALCATRRRQSIYSMPTIRMDTLSRAHRHGAAQVVLPTNAGGLMLLNCGVPSRAPRGRVREPTAS